MEPSKQDKVDMIFYKEGIAKGLSPFVCFSPNWLEMTSYSFGESISVKERQEKYILLMATVIDYIVDKFNADVCLLPHMYGGLLSDNKNDDIQVSNIIYDKLANKNKVTVIRGKYMPDEIKGIIGNCDMFLGGRMHATIASTSQYVPTITFAYGEKYYHIIGETMGQTDYIIDLTNNNYDAILQETINKINILWENRETVIQNLKVKTSQVKQIALQYPELIKKLIEK
jgi:polysaccharide pyruvyl transferase WcaK-like protein